MHEVQLSLLRRTQSVFGLWGSSVHRTPHAVISLNILTILSWSCMRVFHFCVCMHTSNCNIAPPVMRLPSLPACRWPPGGGTGWWDSTGRLCSSCHHWHRSCPQSFELTTISLVNVFLCILCMLLLLVHDHPLIMYNLCVLGCCLLLYEARTERFSA